MKEVHEKMMPQWCEWNVNHRITLFMQMNFAQVKYGIGQVCKTRLKELTEREIMP
jgi:hypothetical protein